MHVVIAAYNESAAIGAVLDDIAVHVPAARVLVVDDASTDNTGSTAAGRGVCVLRHPINRGQGAALQTGIEAALQEGARIIVTFDADGQHCASDIPAMVQPIECGEADVVLGSRFLTGQPPDMPSLRRMMLRLAILLTRMMTGLAVTDTHNGFRALSREAAGRIRLRQDRMAHASEILDQIATHRLRYVERPVTVRYSDYSMSKGQRNRDAAKILLRVLLDKVTH